MRKFGILVVVGLSILALIVVSILLYVNRANTYTLDVYGTLSPFTLESAAGGEYHSDNGKVKLLTFFLINCPNAVCPLTMQDFSKLQEELKAKGWFGTEVELVGITFDPARDTLEAIREYSQRYQADYSGWHFLRGEEGDHRHRGRAALRVQHQGRRVGHACGHHVPF